MTTPYCSLILISAAALVFQVTLTRYFAIAQGHHFAFMAVSLALLGAGASGTYLTLRPPVWQTWDQLLTLGAACFSLAVPLSILALNYLPFDAYRIAWERTQLLWLVLYYLALTVPFFFAGLIVGVALAIYPARAGPVYAANLLGAGLGPPLALAGLTLLGSSGTIFMCSLLGWLAVLSGLFSAPVGSPTGRGQGKRGRVWLQIGSITILPLLFYLVAHPPHPFEVQLTPYKTLTQTLYYPGSQVVLRRENAFARLDVARSAGIRSAPGLSFTYPGDLPPQLGLLVDGDNLSPITDQDPSERTFSAYLLAALPFSLRPNADILILEPGGGLAVLTALQLGGHAVTVVHSNPAAVAILADQFAEFNHQLYHDPRVSVVVDGPRSYLSRTDQTFDLIIFPLTDSFRPVSAGAYTLSEDYRYTVETFQAAFGHLSPRGVLVAERWLQLPPSESLRLWGIMLEVADRVNQGGPIGEQLFALRSLQTGLLGLAREPLTPADRAVVRRFAAERQFDLVWLPGMQAQEANRFSVVPQAAYHQAFTALLTSPDRADFFARYSYAVAPTSDDHPFFFHFFKWQQIPQIVQSLGKTWQPFGGSGFLVLLLLLLLVLLLSVGLILLPLFWGNRTPAAKTVTVTGRWRWMVYFTLLGLGFLFVEIPLLQRFILYLGQPVYALAVILSTLLTASGLGSLLLVGRLPLRTALILVVGLAVGYPWLLPHLFDSTLLLPFAGRIMVTVLGLLPLGLLMGIPFPGGLLRLSQTAPQLVPWIWAVNGCASVVSAILAPVVALTWGFSRVLWGAGLAYALAALVILREPETPDTP